LAIVHGAPQARRDFLDGFAAKLYPAHGTAWRRYRQILARRNHLLQGRFGGSVREQLDPWDQQLIHTGLELIERRLTARARLGQEVAALYPELTGRGEVRLAYRSSMGEEPGEESFRRVLDQRHGEEVRRGVSVVVTGWALPALLSTRVAGIPLVTEHAGSWVPPVFEHGLLPAPLIPVGIPFERWLPRPIVRRMFNSGVANFSAYTDGFNRAAAQLDVAGLPGFASLLRRALEETDRTAIVQFSLRQKTRLGALRSRDKVLMLQSLLWDDEVREADFPSLKEDVRVSAQELKMASSLVDNMSTDFSPDKFSDEYQDQLRQLMADEQMTSQGAPGVRPYTPRFEH
jgi:hypothetical protein